jgi:hypothetical protein
VTHSESIKALASALSKAQGAMKPALKDAKANYGKYADLAANVEAAREHLAANGLAVVQEATTVERGVAVATTLLHNSGEWIKFDPLTVPMGKIDAHGVGSATTYARRYSLGAALGLVADDDDGAAAVASGPAPSQSVAKPNGFDVWWAAVQKAADTDTPTLQSAWEVGTLQQRAYVASMLSKEWEATKAKAAGKKAA